MGNRPLKLVKNPVTTQINTNDEVGPNYASLNEKQRGFVEGYLLHGNAKQAAIEAGYNPNNAATNTTKLLKHETIKEALKERQAHIKKNVQNPLTPEEMRMLLAQMARNTQSKDQDRIKAIRVHAELDGLLIKRIEGNITTEHILNSEDLDRLEKDITNGLLTCEDGPPIIDMD
jgi:hypothetical protein